MVAEAGPAFIPPGWLCRVGGLSLDSYFYFISSLVAKARKMSHTVGTASSCLYPSPLSPTHRE